jgi:hypothetical protein
LTLFTALETGRHETNRCRSGGVDVGRNVAVKAITAHPTKSTHLSLFAVKPYPRPLLAKLFGEEGIIGRRRLLVSVPFAVATVQARLFELLPSPPLTTS